MTKKLDFSNFKKVGGTSRYSIFEDGEGNMIRLSHKSIEPEHAKGVRKLPFAKYNKGGKVRAEKKGPKLDPKKTKEFEESLRKSLGMSNGGVPDANKVMDPARAMAQLLPGSTTFNGQFVPPDQEPLPMPALEVTPLPQQPVFQSPPQVTMSEEQMARGIEDLTQPAPDPYTQYQTTMAGAEEQFSEAMKTKAAAEQELASERAKIADDAARQAQAINEQRQIILKEQQDLANQLSDMEDRGINRERIYGNMGTGQKIATVIGLIAGGLAAGQTGGRNLGAEALDRLIEQDLREQEKNMAQQNNVLKYNMQLLGNREDALRMREAQMRYSVGLKLDKAAAQAQSDMARAQLQQTAAEQKQRAAQTGLAIGEKMLERRQEAQKQLVIQQEKQQEEIEQRRGELVKAENVLTQTTEALDILETSEVPLIGNVAVGIAGKTAAAINPSSAGNRLLTRLKEIKANLGFQALAEMRAASKTGGALGNVTEGEIARLEAAVANLDTWTTAQDLQANLQEVAAAQQAIIDKAKKGGKATIEDRPTQKVPARLGFKSR